jgi:hypothetical protein
MKHRDLGYWDGRNSSKASFPKLAFEIEHRYANPGNTIKARLTANRTSLSNRPIVSPILPRGTVCVLSTMI